MTCGQVAKLVRNQCQRCAPEVHRCMEVAKQAFDRLYEKYLAQTGKEPITEWVPFVLWAVKHEPDEWAVVNGRCA